MLRARGCEHVKCSRPTTIRARHRTVGYLRNRFAGHASIVGGHRGLRHIQVRTTTRKTSVVLEILLIGLNDRIGGIEFDKKKEKDLNKKKMLIYSEGIKECQHVLNINFYTNRGSNPRKYH